MNGAVLLHRAVEVRDGEDHQDGASGLQGHGGLD